MSLFGECSHIVIKSRSYIFHKQPEVIQEQLLNVEPEAAVFVSIVLPLGMLDMKVVVVLLVKPLSLHGQGQETIEVQKTKWDYAQLNAEAAGNQN